MLSGEILHTNDHSEDIDYLNHDDLQGSSKQDSLKQRLNQVNITADKVLSKNDHIIVRDKELYINNEEGESLENLNDMNIVI